MSDSALPVDTATLTETIRQALGSLIDERTVRLANWGDADAALAALSSLETRLEEAERMLDLCAADTTAADLAQDIEFLKAEKEAGVWGHAEARRQIIEQSAINAQVVRSRDEQATRAVAAEAREKALRDALKRIANTCVLSGPVTITTASHREAAEIARAALVRGEEKGLEAGDGSAVLAEEDQP